MITVSANGFDFTGWKSISVTAGLKDAVRSFSMEIAEVDGFGVGQQYWTPPGTPVKIRAGSDLLLDGFVNEYTANTSATDRGITIAGRGKSQDAVDSSADHPTGRFENMDPVEIGNQLLSPFGLSVSATDVLRKLPKFQINVGESPFSAIERLARAQGYAVYGLADGGIEITRASDRSMGAILAEGQWPFLSASGTISDTAKNSTYQTKSQLGGGEDRYGQEAAQLAATVRDETVERFRPKVVVAEAAIDGQMAQQRAAWQAQRRAGQSVKLEVEVQGHHYDGRLWIPNRKVFVHSDFLKISREMLIEQVVWKMDSGGSTSSLSMVPPKAWGKPGTKKDGSKSASKESVSGDSNKAWDGSDPQAVRTPDLHDDVWPDQSAFKIGPQ